MSYKEIYKKDHEKDFKRANVIQYILGAIMIIAMWAAMFGLAIVDGNTKLGFSLIIGGIVVMCVISLFVREDWL